MAHSKNIKENVHDPLTLCVFEDQPSGAMERVEPLVGLIAKIQEKFPDFSTLFSSSKEIQVRIGSLEGPVSCAWTMILYGNSAEEPKDDPSSLCLVQYSFRFVRYC